MEEWISLRAYAKHRGVALSAVQKAIKSGRVSVIRRDERQRVIAIEKHAADQQWAQNTDALEAARNGKFPSQGPTASAAAGAEAGAQGAIDKPAEKAAAADNQGDFLAARVKESTLRGELLELEKLEKIGELLPRAVVRKEFTEIFAQLKNAALRIPDRKSQVLAGETDPTRVQRVLSDEIRNLFDEFSRQLLAPTAGLADDAGVDREREATVP
jgi:hypothetical protein